MYVWISVHVTQTDRAAKIVDSATEHGSVLCNVQVVAMSRCKIHFAGPDELPG